MTEVAKVAVVVFNVSFGTSGVIVAVLEVLSCDVNVVSELLDEPEVKSSVLLDELETNVVSVLLEELDTSSEGLVVVSPCTITGHNAKRKTNHRYWNFFVIVILSQK